MVSKLLFRSLTVSLVFYFIVTEINANKNKKKAPENLRNIRRKSTNYQESSSERQTACDNLSINTNQRGTAIEYQPLFSSDVFEPSSSSNYDNYYNPPNPGSTLSVEQPIFVNTNLELANQNNPEQSIFVNTNLGLAIHNYDESARNVNTNLELATQNILQSAGDSNEQATEASYSNNIEIPNEPTNIAGSSNLESFLPPEFQKCDFCGKDVLNKESWLAHHLYDCSEIPKNDSYWCCVCRRQFKKIYDLEQHLRTHTGEKPFACDSCDKTFSHALSLKRHSKKFHNKY